MKALGMSTVATFLPSFASIRIQDRLWGRQHQSCQWYLSVCLLQKPYGLWYTRHVSPWGRGVIWGLGRTLARWGFWVNGFKVIPHMKLRHFLGDSILSFVTPLTHACLHRKLGHAVVKHLVPVSSVVEEHVGVWVDGCKGEFRVQGSCCCRMVTFSREGGIVVDDGLRSMVGLSYTPFGRIVNGCFTCWCTWIDGGLFISRFSCIVLVNEFRLFIVGG